MLVGLESKEGKLDQAPEDQCLREGSRGSSGEARLRWTSVRLERGATPRQHHRSGVSWP